LRYVLATTIDKAFKKSASKAEGDITVDISYDLIRQFSHQLYTNPRKAIEELVCNSYDAGATECHVRTPRDAADSLMVLDNGRSMDFAGLQALWRVAHSPKTANPEGYRIDGERSQIGKFGVGKLAAFALGRTLTHVAVKGGWARVIAVSEEGIRNTPSDSKPKFSVYKVAEKQARVLIEPVIGDLPKPWARGWDSWTLAIVSDIEESALRESLKTGFLRRMLSHAMPLAADFSIQLDGQRVPERELPADKVQLSFAVTDPEYQSHLESTLQAYWRERLALPEGTEVDPSHWRCKKDSILDPSSVHKRLAALSVPHLGSVAGEAVMAKNPLTGESLSERGYRDNGFKVFVHGKLANPEDELLGITQRSHRYWSRFRGVIEAPSMDEVLLVQRNSFAETSVKTQILREVLRALFQEAKARFVEVETSPEWHPEPFGDRLFSISPIVGQLALTGLAKPGTDVGSLSDVNVEFRALGPEAPAAQYNPETRTIEVNADNPTLEFLDDVEGDIAPGIRQVFAEVIAGTVLSTGFLKAKGVEVEVAEGAAQLIEDTIRSAGGYLRDPVETMISELEETCDEGDEPFERAVVRALNMLKISTTRYGGPDRVDGVVEIPIAGAANLKIAIEAKGGKAIITHKELLVADVLRHSEEMGCTKSIAVAREFQTTGIGGKPSALIRDTQGKVSLIPLTAVFVMLRLHQRQPFTHDKLAEILTTWTHPDRVEEFAKVTWETLPNLGHMRTILEVAWQHQQEEDTNVPTPGMILGDPRVRPLKIPQQKFNAILETLATTTGMVVIKDERTYAFELRAAPEVILDALTASRGDIAETVKPETPKRPPKS
jgi:Histidine kinase-, DNA gyrase B-, and HSP90-like ATPase